MAIEVPIKITTQGGQEAAKQFDVLGDNVLDARKEIERFGDATADANVLRSNFKLLGMDIKDTAKQARLLNSELDSKIANPYENVEKGLKSLEQQAKKTDSAVGNVGLKNQVESVGDASSGFSALAGATSSLGGSQIGAGIQVASDITGAIEYLPKLSNSIVQLGVSSIALGGATAVLYGAIKVGTKIVDDATKPLEQFVAGIPEVGAQAIDLFEIFKSGTSESIAAIKEEAALREELLRSQISQLRGLSEQANSAIEGKFGKVGQVFGDLVGLDTDSLDNRVKELELDLATTGGQVGYLNSQYVQQRIAINDLIAALDEEKNKQVELQQLIAFGSTQEIERRTKVLEIERQAQADDLERAQQRIFELVRQDEVFGDAFANAGNNLEDFREVAKSLGATAVDTDEQLIRFLQGLTGGQAEITALTDRFVEGTAAIADYDSSLEELNNVVKPQVQLREEETAAISRQNAVIKDLTSQRDKSTAALRDIGDQIKDFVAGEALESARKKQEDAIKATRSEEERLLKSRYDSLIGAREAAKAQEKLSAIASERTSKIADINIKFFNDNLKRYNEFYLKESRILEDNKNKRLDLIQSTQDQLFEASKNNDVDSFISALKAGDRALATLDRDTSIDARRRAEDFALANNDAITNRQKEVEAVQQASAAKLQAEQDAATKSLTLEQQYQAELATLKARYQQEDLRRQQEFDRQASLARYNALVVQLNEQQRLQAEAQKALAQNAAVAGQNADVSLLNSFQQTVASVANRGGVTNAAANVIPKVNFTAFADGGLITRPTMALMGERPGYNEMIIPFKKSEGLPGAMGRGGISITITGNNFGQVASPADLAAMENRISAAVVNGITQGFSA